MKNQFLASARSFDHWTRLFLIIVYFFVKRIVDFFIMVLAAVQFLFMTLTSSPNPNLLDFSKSLSTFAYQIMLFVTYASNERPFPFSPWPKK